MVGAVRRSVRGSVCVMCAVTCQCVIVSLIVTPPPSRAAKREASHGTGADGEARESLEHQCAGKGIPWIRYADSVAISCIAGLCSTHES